MTDIGKMRIETILPDNGEAKRKAEQDRVFVETYARSNDPLLAIIKSEIRDYRYSLEYVAQRQLARPEIKAAIIVMQAAQGTVMALLAGKN